MVFSARAMLTVCISYILRTVLTCSLRQTAGHTMSVRAMTIAWPLLIMRAWDDAVIGRRNARGKPADVCAPGTRPASSRLGPRSLAFLARRPIWREAILGRVGQFLFIVKLENHDICAPIAGMGREVAIFRCIRILFQTTTNPHDLPRTDLLTPLLNQVNGL